MFSFYCIFALHFNEIECKLLLIFFYFFVVILLSGCLLQEGFVVGLGVLLNHTLQEKLKGTLKALNLVGNNSSEGLRMVVLFYGMLLT